MSRSKATHFIRKIPFLVLLVVTIFAKDSLALSTSSRSKKRIVVVGGGVGGLAVACRIKHQISSCVDVHIVEKNDSVGGRCGSYFVNVPPWGTFRRERGPSLLLLPHVYQRFFDDLGEEKGFEIRQCIPAYQVVFDDGDRINVGIPPSYTDLLEESRRKLNQFEANGADKWHGYLKTCEAFLDCGLPNFIEEKFELSSFPSFLRESLRDFCKAWPLKPHSDVLDAIFESDKMKALASFQNLYVGLEPYKNEKLFAGGVFASTAPAVFGLLSAIELHPTNPKCGVYAPVGGFGAVSDRLEQLALKLGVKLHYNTTVTSVSTDGVHYQNEQGKSQYLPADGIVMNADLPYATKSLLENKVASEAVYDWDNQYLFSSGVVAFHWSLNRTLHSLNTHNVFLSTRTKESWKTLRDNDFTETVEPFNFYVHRPSCTDATATPLGCDSILVLVPCPTLQRSDTPSSTLSETYKVYQSQFNDDRINEYREAVLNRLETIETAIRSLIVHEDIDTPATYAAKYHVGAGAPFGLSHGLGQLSVTRPSSRVENIWFCGASTRPGNGVPLVLLGAEKIAESVVRRISSRVEA